MPLERRSIWTIAALALSVVAGCGGEDSAPDEAPAPPGDRCAPLANHLERPPVAGYSADRVALAGRDRFDCGESWFWVGLSLDIDARPPACVCR